MTPNLKLSGLEEILAKAKELAKTVERACEIVNEINDIEIVLDGIGIDVTQTLKKCGEAQSACCPAHPPKKK